MICKFFEDSYVKSYINNDWFNNTFNKPLKRCKRNQRLDVPLLVM